MGKLTRILTVTKKKDTFLFGMSENIVVIIF